MSNTFAMSKPIHVIPPPAFYAPPPFIAKIMESVRAAADQDGAIRVRMDTSTSTMVQFNALWSTGQSRDIARRVYANRVPGDDGQITLNFMAKLFDSNTVEKKYAPDDHQQIAKDVVRYLRMGQLS